ncbi:tRNA pseudouridine(38-40) synthase TruA [endosymbiont GvMRE of Glomus versiforme]|uniref:tRNA pseudouridine(38-40) synthase TruA n=1 Tax=endosymbiont GvMRE of Glomus versiforme TaxID=2039283 RepID=UPI000ED7A7C5|nr:tRNA pseudouridine(38-40) synthase TruA [endosymbiont GvMRE of Glomus versiforme]RHZ35295.1 tRNA pseudouridine synthase A [endosymbiont GvMRE of Glomus versiforme]
MYFYLITIAYDGSDFTGWAKQPNKLTIQECIENVLSSIFKQTISVLASSRTDKGVHACDQKFTLRLTFNINKKQLFNLLKNSLKKYVFVKKVEKVSCDFHPIYNVLSKEYRYFINVGKYNFFQKKYCWEYNKLLEAKKINNILQIFQGRHDFFNFSYCRWQEREKTNTEREITSLKSWKRENIIIISITAKSFLRYQIRAIIGEVINCYEGKQTIADLKEKMTNFAKKNYKYKNIAPAAGLYLWKIDWN